jgi:hypothetical protein
MVAQKCSGKKAAPQLKDALQSCMAKAIRQPALYDQLFLSSIPVIIIRAFVLRGYFDHYYHKAEVSEDEWERTRGDRSYHKLLRAHGVEDPCVILDAPGIIEWEQLGTGTKHHREVTLQFLLDSESFNFEDTDRGTLRATSILGRMAVSRGAKREAAVVLGRLSSSELAKVVFQQLGDDGSQFGRASFRKAIDAAIRGGLQHKTA